MNKKIQMGMHEMRGGMAVRDEGRALEATCDDSDFFCWKSDLISDFDILGR
jgi:hypothetical protein